VKQPQNNDGLGCSLFVAGAILLFLVPPAGVVLIVVGIVIMLGSIRLW
jgi:hypothetical protein